MPTTFHKVKKKSISWGNQETMVLEVAEMSTIYCTIFFIYFHVSKYTKGSSVLLSLPHFIILNSIHKLINVSSTRKEALLV